MSRAKSFLESLFGGKPEHLRVLLWTLPEKDSRWFQSIGEAVVCAESFSAHDLYVGVGLASRDYGPKQRCKSHDVAGIVAVWADIDLRSDAHPKETLPATVEQALSILPPELPPSVVVRTGNGVHVWWILKEPWIFESDADRRAAAALISRFHTLLRGNAGQCGWTYERLADLARVLRVPGTQNCKDPLHPKAVVIHSQAENRYDSTDFADYLDDLGIPGDEVESSETKNQNEGAENASLTIDLNSRISDDRLNHWLEINPRFKATWFRQRSDLHDQSQSGYDLALADFGFRAGCLEQEIIDLIVQHRFLHHQKARTSIDYFKRTLAKASGTTAPAQQFHNLLESARAGTTAAPNDSARGTATDIFSRSKAQICRALSTVLEVEVLRIVKISGKQPLYRMETTVGKIEFDDVAKLITQSKVRTAIAARAGKLIRGFKPKEWEQIAQLMLDACIDQDGGEELQLEGTARIYLCQYLSETDFIDAIEGQQPQGARKPMIREGRITVCASDLQLFINKTTAQNIPVREIVAMLSAIGAISTRARGRKIKEQSRWILPEDDFAVDDYASSEPTNPGEKNG